MNDIESIRQAIRTPAYDEALAERLGLNITDLRSLELVIAEPGLTAGRLAERLDLTTGAVTGVLDRLEAAGFVGRRPDPDDRRSVTIHPIEQRSAELAAARDPLGKAIGRLLNDRPAAERAALATFLRDAADTVHEETARLRASSRGGFVGSSYSAPLGAATRGRLVFQTGAPRLALNFAPIGPRANARVIMETAASRLRFEGVAPDGELIRGAFKGPQPEIRSSGGIVTIRYRRQAIAAFSGREATLALSAAIPWTIEVEGGLTDLSGSLAALQLAGIEIAGGASHVSLTLPAATGSVPVRLAGVASDVKLRRPAASATGLRVEGGVARLRLDAERHENVSGRRVFRTAGFDTSVDRYEIEILGGASDVRVTVD